MVGHAGFEPAISSLRGRCPKPLDECPVRIKVRGLYFIRETQDLCCSMSVASYNQVLLTNPGPYVRDVDGAP
jgi:hypothetical protein